MQHSITVLINNYNYADFLTEALDSALSQLEPGDEVLVVDDGSSDGSLELLERYAHRPEVRIISQQNAGQLAAVRRGINESRKQLIALLDSDDYFLPGYLQRVREVFRNHQTDFLLSRAQVFGDDVGSREATRHTLDKMEFPSGPIGPTYCATCLFYEFVGVPTSGLVLQRQLANQVMALSTNVDAKLPIHPWLARLLGIPPAEASQGGLTADGVIVRGASMRGALKYYDARPGFAYRIHGANKFATVGRLGRWYTRQRRKRELVEAMSRDYGLPARPHAQQLRSELKARQFSKRWLRRLRIRMLYALAALRCRGSWKERGTAFIAALGLYGVSRESP